MPEEQNNMIQWEKPDGSTIQTNDNPATIKQAKALNWKQVGGQRQAQEKDDGNQPNQKQAPKNQEGKV